jgi:hypothetical protein
MADHTYRSLDQPPTWQRVRDWWLGNVGIPRASFAHSLYISYSNYFDGFIVLKIQLWHFHL